MDKFRKPYSSNNNGNRGRGEGRPSFGTSSSRPRFGGAGGGDFRREAPQQKYDAICSTCGKRCQVPFRPDGSRPVYFNECFGAPHDVSESKGKFAGRKDFAQRPFEAPRAGGKSIADLERQIGAMNTKIDTMLRILESMPSNGAATVAAAPASFVPAPSFPVPANVTAPRKFVKKASPAKKFVRKPGVPKRK